VDRSVDDDVHRSELAKSTAVLLQIVKGNPKRCIKSIQLGFSSKAQLTCATTTTNSIAPASASDHNTSNEHRAQKASKQPG